MAKKIFSKRTLAALLTLVMVFNLTGIGALAAQPQEFTLVQNFQDTYYKQDGSAGSANDWQIHLSKTAAPTAQDNVYSVTLKVETKNTTTEIAGSTHGAAVLVLDVSNSMNTKEGKSGKTQLDSLKTAVGGFLDSFAANAGTGEKRLVSVVVFGTGAKTIQSWVDVANADARANVKSIINSLSAGDSAYLGGTWLFDGGTNMEGGLVLGRNLLKQAAVSSIPVANQSLILFSDGDPTVSVSNANSNATDSIGYGGSDIGYQTDWADYDNIGSILSGVSAAKIAVAYNYSNNMGILKAPPFTRVINSNSGSLSVDLQGEAGKVITVATNASTITDPMGQGVSMVSVASGYDQATQKWDLSQYTPHVADGITTYTVTYEVKIDPEAVAADPAYPAYTVLTPANGETTLNYTYGEEDSAVRADFNEPNIRGVRSFKVSYEYTGQVPQGAPQLPGQKSYKVGQSVEIAAAPSMENYTFSGWDKTDFAMPAEDVVIRGSWTENHKYDYAVTYNANFGVNPAVNADSENISGIYATSHSIGVDSNRFVRPDYTFIGWNTQADGSGVSYKAGNVITLTARENTKVLYAQWQENPKYSYTVQYNENYGAHPIVYRDSESVSNIYATGYTIGVDENRFNRVNYTFIGWNTQADGSGKAYKEGETIALTAENNSAILYAQWQENPKYDYEVIYNANFGAGQIMLDSQNVTGTYANPYTIGVDENRFTRPNYTFIGWAEEPQGQVVYQSGDSILFTESGRKILYAKWIEHNKYSFTLIYNGNGGALADGHTAYGDSENAEGIYDNHHEIAVDRNTFAREGYTFIGWNTKADGAGINCNPEDLVALTALHNTMTLYAQWQEIPKYDYEVIYNANFGEEPATRADDQNVKGVYSTELNFSVDAEEFIREGYTFTGWNTESDGTGKAYVAGDIIALTAEENTEILYAQWSVNEYEYTVQYVVRVDAGPYAAFQGQLPENAPQGGKAVYGEVIDATTLQLPETIADGTYVYTYTAVDGIVIPYGANVAIVYYSAVTPIVEIPEEEIPLIQPPTNEPAPVNPGSEPVPTTPATPSAPLVELPDEEVPLADAPKTGDAMTLYMGLTALSGVGLLGLGLTKKKEENEEN